MQVRAIVVPVLLLLASCGGGGPQNNGVAANALGADVAGGPRDCASLPDFVALQGDASGAQCFAAPGVVQGQQSGTVVYTSAAAPAQSLAFYQGEAARTGLTPGHVMEGENAMFSAQDGFKRRILVAISSNGSGSRVTINWSRQN